MEYVLKVNRLNKEYSNFKLENVSFSIKQGSIMGFIGRNGAGKTTTLKALMNLVRPSSGEIELLSMSLREHEKEIKQRVGYATGGISYYKRKKLIDIINITKIFYRNWDDEVCRHYLKMFALDKSKKLFELSEGMKVKFNLTIALSHHAELLILDEPTSGLDPVSRDELLEIFLDLAKEGVSILFSTHIISDLDRCADTITYIRKGKILASEKIDEFLENYSLIDLPDKGIISDNQKGKFLGVCLNKNGSTALVRRNDEGFFKEFKKREPDLESIMIHLEKEGF